MANLGRSIRHTVALAEKLEHQPNAAATHQAARNPGQPKALPKNDSDHDGAREQDAERERETAEKYDYQEEEEKRFRPFAETIGDIYRNLGLPPIPRDQNWRQRFLFQLEAIFTFASKHKATTAPATAPEPLHNTPSTAPPDGSNTS
jgi:hypothetical protein